MKRIHGRARAGLLSAIVLAASLSGCAVLRWQPPPEKTAEAPAPETEAAKPAREPDPASPATKPVAGGDGTPPVLPAGEAPAPPPPPKPAAVPPGPPFDAGGRLVLEPGLYRCELNRRVTVRRIASDGQTLVLNWLNKDYTLNVVPARSGAIRYEDARAGFAWITIVGKSLLLDMRRGQQLANECRL